jgi:hypothetical protein
MSKPTTTAITTTKASAAPAVVAPSDPRFDNLRKMVAAERNGLCQALAMMVLTGLELKRLKKLHGIKRGGDRTPKVHGGPLLTFEDLVEQQTGGKISVSSAKRRVLLAESVKTRSKALLEMEDKLLALPFGDQPPDVQEKTFSLIERACDGETFKSLTAEQGLIKQDKGHFPDKHRNKGGNSTKKKETPEEEAQNHFHGLHVSLLGLRCDNPDAFKRRLYTLPLELGEDQTTADTVCLAELHEELQQWLTAVAEARNLKARALHKAKGKTAEARLQEATESMLATLPAESKANRS